MSSQKKAKKAGRPPLPKGDARAAFLRIRVTPEELQDIKLEAKSKKKSVSEWIRKALYDAL
jgi:predicted HicB family RNase H-like nuclease